MVSGPKYFENHWIRPFNCRFDQPIVNSITSSSTKWFNYDFLINQVWWSVFYQDWFTCACNLCHFHSFFARLIQDIRGTFGSSAPLCLVWTRFQKKFVRWYDLITICLCERLTTNSVVGARSKCDRSRTCGRFSRALLAVITSCFYLKNKVSWMNHTYLHTLKLLLVTGVITQSRCGVWCWCHPNIKMDLFRLNFSWRVFRVRIVPD